MTKDPAEVAGLEKNWAPSESSSASKAKVEIGVFRWEQDHGDDAGKSDWIAISASLTLPPANASAPLLERPRRSSVGHDEMNEFEKPTHLESIDARVSARPRLSQATLIQPGNRMPAQGWV